MISIIIGYILDLIIGDPNNPYHPVCFIGKWGMFLEKNLRRIFKKNLKFAGLIAWILIIVPAFFITFFIVYFTKRLNIYFGIFIEGIIIYFCVAGTGLKKEGLKVLKSLKEGDIVEARKKLSYIVGRDTENLDEEAIIRAVIETVAENMSDGIIAPLFFIGIFGAPFGILYKAVNTCDSMFGYKNDKYRDFGYVSAKLDDVFNFIPARLTAFLIIISSGILRLNFKNAIKIYWRDKKNHKSPNSAHPEAAVAGSLSIKLGGSNYYFGKLVEKPTIGDNLKEIEVEDLYKTNKILDIAYFLGIVIAIGICFLMRGKV